MTVYRKDHITVHVASDEMAALLSINAKGVDFPPRHIIESALSAAGVRSGIDQSALAEILKLRLRVHERVIARGTAPVAGEPDQLIWSIDIIDQNRPRINVDGKADFKQLNQFQPVSAGDQLVALLPGKASVAGVTVTGLPLAAGDEGKILSLPGGLNTRLSKDGLTLNAAIDGIAMLRDGLVTVDTVLQIAGDVDFNTGNVNYQGSVTIAGDVRSGFRVEATEAIYINGTVEAAEIYSKNGSIIIQNGILGQNRARILAGNDLHCGFIQDATASVKNDVIIDHYAINSNITSGGKISLLEHEGLIRGGKTVAEKGIELLVAGSERNILTELFLTRSDIGNEQSRLWQAKIRLAEEYQLLDKQLKRIEFLELLRQRLGAISEEREIELSSLRDQVAELEQQVELLKHEMSQLSKAALTDVPEQAVKIIKQLYRKVTVTIGHKKYFSTSSKGGLSIYRQGDEMLVDPMS